MPAYALWLVILTLSATPGARSVGSTPTPAVASQVNLQALTPTDKHHFDQVAADEFCGCSSSLTLADCLKKRPTCQIAHDIAQILARAAALHFPQKAIAAFASQAILGPFCAPPAKFNLTGAAHKGAPNAPITVVEFADFRCTHCRHAVPRVHAALKRFDGQVQLIYAPVALDENSSSMAAAEASMAALDQEKFWPMHAALFAREAGDFDAANLLAAAKMAGLNMKRYQDDMVKHKHRSALARFKAEGIAAGLTGTPLFFVAGRRYDFDPDLFSLDERLQMELDRNAGKCD